MALLDLDALRRAQVTHQPFSFTVVRGFVPKESTALVGADFPAISHPGLLPLAATTFGPSFAALTEGLRSPELARILSDKFHLDLTGRSTMITVRGRCQEKDGRIHTDSTTKLVTALIYFNDPWDAPGGRFRLLRQPDNLDDIIAEVPPDAGTLVAFRRSECSFHGHEPFVGVRRSVMINWMASSFAAQRELLRHHISATAKRAIAAAEQAWL